MRVNARLPTSVFIPHVTPPTSRMQLHQKLLALALVASVLLPLILVPVPTQVQIQQAAPACQAEGQICTDCGVVASVNLIGVKSEGGYLGALFGVYTGRAPEVKSRNGNQFEVVVRMPGGTTRTVTYATEPGFKACDKVQIIDGLLTHMP